MNPPKPNPPKPNPPKPNLPKPNSRDVRLIATYSGRHAIRGGTGLVFVVVLLLGGLFIAHLIMTPLEQIRIQAKREGQAVTDEQILAEIKRNARPLVGWVVGGRQSDEPDDREAEVAKEEWVDYLLEDQPALLTAVVLVLLYCTPFFVILGAFNLFSGDIQSRGLRYLLLRTERSNIFFGRYLGTVVFTIILFGLLFGVIIGYMGLKLDVYSWPALLFWGLRAWLAVTVLTFPYAALAAWISSAVDSPFGSLVISNLLVGSIPLFALLGKSNFEWLTYIVYLIPWGTTNGLLHYDLNRVVATIGASAIYSVVFLAFGYRYFAKRDL